MSKITGLGIKWPLPEASQSPVECGPGPADRKGFGTIAAAPGYLESLRNIAAAPGMSLAEKAEMAWEGTKSHAGALLDKHQVLERGMGGLQLAGGLATVATGATLSGSGGGAVLGVPLAAYGGDVALAGFRQLASGKPQTTATHDLLERASGSKNVAAGATFATDVLASFIVPPSAIVKAPALVDDAAQALKTIAQGGKEFPIFNSGSLRGGAHEAGWLEEQLQLPHGLDPKVYSYLKPGTIGGLTDDKLGAVAGQGYWNIPWRYEQLNNNVATHTGKRPEDFKLAYVWAGGAEDGLPLSAKLGTPLMVIDNGPKVDFLKVIESWPEPFQMAPLHSSFEAPLDLGASWLRGDDYAKPVADAWAPFLGPQAAGAMSEMVRSALWPVRDFFIKQADNAFMDAHRPYYERANLIGDTVATGSHQILYPEALPLIKNKIMMPEQVDGLPIDHITIFDASLDHFNRMLDKLVKPDGTVLNPHVELKAGRLSQAEYDDLMTYRPLDLTRFDAGKAGAVLGQLREQGISDKAIEALVDAGALRLPYGGGVELLGRGTDGKLRSVMNLSPDLSKQSIQGFGTFRPVLPGNGKEVAIVPGSLDALRLYSQAGAKGPTVIVDAVESGRATSTLQGKPLLDAAEQVSVPPYSPGRYGPAGDVAQRARYDQILGFIGPEKVVVRKDF